MASKNRNRDDSNRAPPPDVSDSTSYEPWNDAASKTVEHDRTVETVANPSTAIPGVASAAQNPPTKTEPAFKEPEEYKPWEGMKPLDSNDGGMRIDPETGEILGKLDITAQLENVQLVNKIVAKEIVPRSEMIYKKKFIAERKNGELVLDDDGNPVGRTELNDGPRKLYKVYGTVNGMRKGETTFGQWISFTGHVAAIRHSDGMKFVAGEVFLQGAAEPLLFQALLQLKRRDPTGSLQFAFEIGIKPSQKWIDSDLGNSYEYTVTSILNVRQNNPLAELERILEPVLALPKPVTPPTPSSES